MSNDDYVLEVPTGFLMSPDAEADTEGSASTHFAALRLYIKGVIPYSTGQHFTLPGVFQYREDKASESWLNEGLKRFNGFSLGGNKSRLFIMVAEETNKNDAKYQRVKMFKSWQEKDKDFDPPVKHFEWQTHELPAIRQLPADVVTSFEAGKIIHVKYEVLPTGRKFKRQGEEGESGATFWGDFQLYPSWDALMAAKKEHFGGNGSNGAVAAGVDLSNFPELWHNSANPQKGLGDLYANIRTVQDGKFIEKAKEVMLIGPNGQPVNRLGTKEPVNLGELFAKALDVPLTEDISGAFAHLYK